LRGGGGGGGGGGVNRKRVNERMLLKKLQRMERGRNDNDCHSRTEKREEEEPYRELKGKKRTSNS